MDTSTFKKILDNFLIQKGFQKKSRQYYLSSLNLFLYLCALLLLSGCDDLSGFKEVEISQTGISKVCDKKHKLKYPDLVKCLSKRNYEIEPIVILAEYHKTNPTGFISFPCNEIFTPQAGISGFYGKLIGTYDIHVGIYNRSGINLHLKSAQLWIVRGYKSTKNEACKR